MSTSALRIFTRLAIFLSVCCNASGQQPQTTGEFWPEVDARIQFPDNWRLLAFSGLKRGEEFAYQQLHVGFGLGYQWKEISTGHLQNIDQDKEHILVVGGGYEYLHTTSGKPQYESRFVLEAMPGFRPCSRLLVRDRNRVEFRWINGVYSTRYRNSLSFDYDIKAGKFRFTPYASAEVFYDSAKDSWSREQYTAGVEWPYRRVLKLQTYYLRQNCPTCNPAHLNVGGLTLHVFF